MSAESFAEKAKAIGEGAEKFGQGCTGCGCALILAPAMWFGLVALWGALVDAFGG